MLHHNILIAGVLFISGFLTLPARAQAVEQLTSDNVRAFIEKASVIAAGKETEMSGEQIDAYLEEHIHPLAKFKSTMRFAIPGFDMQETTLNVNKDGFIQNVHKATEAVSDYESQIEITDILVSKDGKKATLKTRSMESGQMPVADHIEKEDVPMQGVSTCEQTLVLSKKGIIQMYNANCVTEVEFQTFDP